MKFSFDWLKRHLDTEKSVFEIADALTSVGIEVESVTNTYDYLKNFIVAEVTSLSDHPDSDHLHVCSVFDGKTTYQIVTGASNVQKNKKYPLAPLGSLIPNGGYIIEKRKLRGIESTGMLCSADELFIPGNYQDGLLELSNSVRVGDTILNALNLSNYIIDVSITPNRGDCFGVRGIARDLAVKGMGKLKPLKIPSIGSSFTQPISVEIDNDASNICPIFATVVIKNIHNTESPEWLKNLLLSAGINPKSAVVDVTNFLSTDIARPLHAYDFNLIAGNELTLKKANNGTKFKDIKGNEILLNDSSLILSDDVSPMSIIGIIGGERTMCSPETTDVLLESCYLNPEKIMQIGQSLNISTDARTRFERGIDPESVILGLKIAASMITEICGGEVSEINLNKSYSYTPSAIDVSLDDFNNLLGTNFQMRKIIEVLKNLEFEVTEKGNDTISVISPSYRHDISIKEDLIEEFARIIGYNLIEDKKFIDTPITRPDTDKEKFFQMNINIKKLLASNGYDENINYSFISKEEHDIFSDQEKIEISNPINQEFSVIRSSLVPSMLKTTAKLLNYGEKLIKLFEIGNIFSTSEKYTTNICGILSEKSGSHKRWNDKNVIDIFSIKSDMFDIIKLIGSGISNIELKKDSLPDFMHPYKSALIYIKNFCLGFFGEVNPIVLKKFGITEKVYIFNLVIENIIAAKNMYPSQKKDFFPSKLQNIDRDFSFIFDESVQASSILNAIKNSDSHIKSIDIFDIYRDKNIGESKKSVALSVVIEQGQIQMTDKDIDLISKKIEKQASSIGGILRKVENDN